MDIPQEQSHMDLLDSFDDLIFGTSALFHDENIDKHITRVFKLHQIQTKEHKFLDIEKLDALRTVKIFLN